MIGTAATVSCILSKFYIKPQLFAILIFLIFSCILSKFYIKPQPCSERDFIRTVVSYRNSTSNHNDDRELVVVVIVVSYRNSTSNHNYVRRNYFERKVVSYRNSTSNHNGSSAGCYSRRLYLIEILHQTTTQ